MKVVNAKTEAQLQEAFNIRKTVFVEEQKVPYELEIDEFENASDHFVLYSEGNPIGAGRFRVLDGKGKIERICVLSTNRGSGAGKILMEAIERYAQEKGIGTLKLNAQTYAIPFYEKLGYSVVSDEFLDAGIPHKTMEKNIT
ncbi:GNAT family N-acetyltransferase [Bacillus sp. IITD106]|nr:GNAT family N-acetyltransferase [Bacillus sp. IITD106]